MNSPSPALSAQPSHPDHAAASAATPQPASASPFELDRRSLFRTGAFGALGAAALWGMGFDPEAAAAPSADGAFGYGVASGDPTATSVIIWTRFSPRVDGVPAAPGSGLGDPAQVRWTVSPSEDCTTAIASGVVTTSPDADHVVKVDVTGLEPYTEYYYVFSVVGSDGAEQRSEVGRTRTAPDESGTTHALRFAQVSCSNYTAGYFGTYRAIAERDDLDFVLHLGDYFYEYGNGDDRYGPDDLVGVRDHEPAHETVTLADYRLRLAQYHADPDQRAAHARHPFITTFDDHEITNNAWSGGAENHDESEGDYRERMDAAFRAYAEWLPIRIDPTDTTGGATFYRRFTYGDLADLSVVDTRQHRSEQVGSFVVIGTPSVNDQLNDPDRHIMEPEQMSWLQDGISGRRRWHLVGNQVMVSPLAWPGQYIGEVQGSVMVNADAWDGYRADQTSLLEHMAAQPSSSGDTVILTGDIHSCWVENLVADANAILETAEEEYPALAAEAFAENPPTRSPQPDPAPAARDDGPIPPMIAEPVPVPDPVPALSLAPSAKAGVEFVCPSITSDGFYEIVRSVLQSAVLSIGAVEAAALVLKALNPQLQWMNGVGHGYVVIDVTDARVQADYYLTANPTESAPNPLLDPDHRPEHRISWRTVAGSREATEASGPVGRRTDEPRIAECAPATETPTSTGSPTSTGAPTATSGPTETGSTSPTPSGTATWPTATDGPGSGAGGGAGADGSGGSGPGGGSGSDGGGAGQPGSGGDLPRTGTTTGGLLGAGLAAVAGGIGLTIAARRRRVASETERVDRGPEAAETSDEVHGSRGRGSWAGSTTADDSTATPPDDRD